MTSRKYVPLDYWSALLARQFDLSGVGYPWLSPTFNAYLYRGMAESVGRALKRVGLGRDQLGQRSVLDVGCGTGFWINFWSLHGVSRIAGMDLTSESVHRLSAEYPQWTFEQRDISDPIAADGLASFDIISAMSVLNHIVSQERWEQALENLGRLLRPGGYVLIMDPVLRYRWWGEPLSAESNGRPRSVQEHASALARAQVSVLRVAPTVAVLANPVDTRTAAEFRFLEIWWGLFSRIAARERAMKWTGPLVFGLDRLLCHLGYMPSSKLLTCRKDSTGPSR